MKVKVIKLGPLKPADGAQLLREVGAEGSRLKLREASKEVQGHPLSLLLLGTYLRDRHDGNVEKKLKDALLFRGDSRAAERADRLMRAYERWFGRGPHLGVLGMIALFDRPAKAGELESLRRNVIPDLSDNVANLDADQWLAVVNRLRRAGLLNEPNPKAPGEIDAHPLVREYFARRLSGSNPAAWEAGHWVLYEHLSQSANPKQLPDSLPKIIPFYQAIHHAAQTRWLETALKDVYWPIIQRRSKGFAHRVLGAFSSELSMIESCFERPWDRPRSDLSPFWQAHVSGIAGSRMRALGQLDDAIAPLKRSLRLHTRNNHRIFAAIRCRHLSELCVELGKLDAAEKYARRGVSLADETRNPRKLAEESRVYKKAGIEPCDLNDVKYERIVERVVLASARHQLGKWETAANDFDDAISVLSEAPLWKRIPVLFSLWGFRYCEFLLDMAAKPNGHDNFSWLDRLREQIGHMRKVSTRTIDEQIPEGDLGLLGPPLLKLMELRADLVELEVKRVFRTADSMTLLKRASDIVDELKQAKRRDFTPLGLFTLAQVQRKHTHDRRTLDGAEGTLNEAEEISKSGTMELYGVDCLIERAWLLLTTGKRREALKKRHAAFEAITRLKYFRRSPDLKRLDRELKVDPT